METPIQRASREQAKRYADKQGTLGPFEALVVSVVESKDMMGLSFGPTRQRDMPIQHPFIGTTSWIRSVPETGTRYLLQNRFDSGQPEALKTLPIFPEKRSKDYGDGLNIYRSLNPGEHDIASAGAALAYFGKRGHLDLRSGAGVKDQLSRESMTKTQSAPTHKRELLFHDVGSMGDEERLGIVKRWKNAIDETYPQKNDHFQAEHYLQIKNPAGSAPSVLIRSIEGQVYEDDGTEIKHFITAIPLRSQKLWYTTNDEYLRQEIDQNGNYLLEFPTTASNGYEALIPNGSFKGTVGVDRDFSIQRDDFATIGGNLQYAVTETALVSANEIILEDTTGDRFRMSGGDVTLEETSGAKLHLTGGTVALGTSAVELVDILSQTLQTLSVTTAAGFGAPINTVAVFAALQAKIDSIKGSI